jgi:phosphoserine phosphatase RsbU/P
VTVVTHTGSKGPPRPARPKARRMRMGVLHDHLTNEYTEAVIAALAAAAREHDVELVCLFGGKLSAADILRAWHPVFDLASDESVDAVLALTMGGLVGTQDIAAFFRRYAPLPICSIGVAWEDHARVLADNEVGLRQGIRHLIRVHGRRRLAFVQGPELNVEARLRYEVYRRVLAEEGIAFDERLVCPGDFEREAGHQAVRLLANVRRVDFDAVVAANDGSAIGVLDELVARGISVPAQVALLGFDDVRGSRHLEPPLTTVRQPLRDQARLAFRILRASVLGDEPPGRELLETELNVRESCGCPPYVHPAIESAARAPHGDGLARMAADLPTLARAIGAAHVPGAPDRSDTPWAERLCREFIAELAGERRSFLKELGAVMGAITAVDGEVGDLHKVVTILVESSRRHLHGADLHRADRLSHAARIKIGGSAERAPARRKLHVESLTRTLVLASRDLAIATDLASIRTALATHLGSCEIPACYVCRYEGADGDRARLVVAFHSERAMELPPGGAVFPSRQLLPAFVDAGDRAPAYLVFPLEFGPGHSGYVVFERGPGDGFVYEGLAVQIGSTLRNVLVQGTLLEESRAREAAEAARVEDEMRIATEIQTGILPRSMRIEGLEIAAAMRPASRVGGDYYDVVPVERGCWIGIGDVSGHGLTSGLVMLMVQSVVSGVARHLPAASPGELLSVVNAVIHENVQTRMAQDEHVTLTLLRYHESGRVTGAGAHELILVCRAEDGAIEWIDTPGTWIGLVADIRSATPDTSFELRTGDLMVLYTDGVTEARNDDGAMFGTARLAAALGSVRHASAEAIRDALLEAVERWAATREDDVSVLVARHHGVASR